MDQTDSQNTLPTNVLAPEKEAIDTYQETDVFAWANNLVQYKDELNIELFFFNKNYTLYKTKVAKELKKQLEPLFIDEILEYVLEGIEKGLVVRNFEDAEAEELVLQRTLATNVFKMQEVLNWLRTQEHEIELFNDEEHDFKRMKGILARVSHEKIEKPFYIFKQLPASNVMQGKVGWMLRSGGFVPFDADAALRISSDPQLLLLDQDLYVFKEARLRQLFGYDAKEASIARQKVAEIEANFALSFDEGLNIQAMLQDKKSLIKKVQKIDPTAMNQDDLMSHAADMGIDLMEDDSGAIIIMDDKDLKNFVNLLNDDIIESPITGQRYEIIKKRPLKLKEEKGEEA